MPLWPAVDRSVMQRGMMKVIVALVCISLPLMAGCSRNQTAALQDQCSGGSAAACEELARAQQASYQQTDSSLHGSRPMIPSPASAAPPTSRSR